MCTDLLDMWMRARIGKMWHYLMKHKRIKEREINSRFNTVRDLASLNAAAFVTALHPVRLFQGRKWQITWRGVDGIMAPPYHSSVLYSKIEYHQPLCFPCHAHCRSPLNNVSLGCRGGVCNERETCCKIGCVFDFVRTNRLFIIQNGTFPIYYL